MQQIDFTKLEHLKKIEFEFLFDYSGAMMLYKGSADEFNREHPNATNVTYRTPDTEIFMEYIRASDKEATKEVSNVLRKALKGTFKKLSKITVPEMAEEVNGYYKILEKYPELKNPQLEKSFMKLKRVLNKKR